MAPLHCRVCWLCPAPRSIDISEGWHGGLETRLEKPERPRHAAAAGVDGLYVGAHLSQQRFFVSQFHERLVMAVAVEQDFPRHARWLVAGRMMLQEFAEQKGLPPQALGAC